MDFPLPAKAQALLAIHPDKNHSLLRLSLGQEIDAKIIKVASDKNFIQLRIAGTLFIAEAVKNNPVSQNTPDPKRKLHLSNYILPGQVLKLQVSRLIPTPELTLLNTTESTQAKQPASGQNFTLKLNPVPLSVESRPLQQTTSLPTLQPGQVFSAKVTQISAHHIHLQLQPETNYSAPRVGVVEIKTVQQPMTVKVNYRDGSLDQKTRRALVAVKPEQRLLLEVTKTGSKPELNIVQIRPAPVWPDKVITEAVKQLLPKQQSVPILLNRILHDLPELSRQERVPETLKRIAHHILQSLPRVQDLTDTKGLQLSIRNSGVMLESKLVHDSSKTPLQLDTDFKANLLKFFKEVKQTVLPSVDQPLPIKDANLVKELLNKTENTIAKLIIDQLSSLPKEESPKQIWTMELPFIKEAKAEAIRIRIEQEKQHNQNPDSQNWSVTINLSPPDLGTIDCKIAFFDRTVNTHFWSNRKLTAELINTNLDFLRQRIESSGLKTGLMTVRQGAPEEHQKHTELTGINLLDETI